MSILGSNNFTPSTPGLLGMGTIGSTGVKPMSELVPKDTGSLFSNTSRASLVIMKPSNARPITDQAHRPNLFNFSKRFAYEAATAIGDAIQSASTTARSVLELAASPSARTAVLPSDMPDTIIRASRLTNNYQFLLSIYENGGGVGSSLSGLQQQRVILTGYFIDEPFNATMINGKFTPNPNATMVFTHRTIVGKMRTTDYSGNPHETYSTYADLHCIDPVQMRGLVDNGTELHLLDPETCYKTVDYSEKGSTFSMPGVQSALDNFERPQGLNTLEDRPIAAVSGILKSVFQGHEQIAMESVLSSYGGSEGFRHPYATTENLRRTVGSNFKSRKQIYEGGSGPKENEHWHMHRLISTYPGIDIVPIDIEGAYMFSAADQAQRTSENVFSALLCNSVPAVMVDGGIGTIAFTATVKDTGPMDEKCFYQVNTWSPLANVNDGELRVKAIMTSLIRGEFESILRTRGPFTVSAKFNLSGRSQVLINFLDNTQPNQVPYEVPTILSGIYSANIGTAPAHGHNAEQMNGLMGVLLGDDAVESAAAASPDQGGLLSNQSSGLGVGGVLGQNAGTGSGLLGTHAQPPQSGLLGTGSLSQPFPGGAGILGTGNGLGLNSGLLGTNRKG